MSTIFGEGSLLIEKDGLQVNLQYGECELDWEDEYEEIKVESGKLLRFYQGSRVRIKATVLNILEDSPQMECLMQIFNLARQDGQGVNVYPKYNWDGGEPYYLCHLPKNFNPKRLGEAGAGQKIELSFEGVDLQSGVPWYDENFTTLVPWQTHSGAQLTDSYGTVLELRM